MAPLRQWIPEVSPALDDPAHLAPLVIELEKVATGEAIEVAVSVPPRHGKTTTIVHWIVWLLCQRPDMRILYCSFGARMAVKQTRAMRALARKVGLLLGEVQTASEWTTAGGGGVKACGITGPPTGDGFHLIIVDDPHRSRKSAESPLERDTVNTGYRDDIYTRQVPVSREQRLAVATALLRVGRQLDGKRAEAPKAQGTSHVIVHTRWHEDDLIGVLTRRDEDGPEPFRLINLPAINEAGEALAPLLWPIEKLRRFERRLGPYAFASLYQGSPRPKGGALFGPPTWADDPPMVATYGGGADLARTAKARSDHQACGMMARDPVTKVCTVVDAERARELLTDKRDDHGEMQLGFARRLHSMQRRWKGAPFRMYVGGAETSLVDLLAVHAEFPAFIRSIKATEDKWGRSQRFAAAWNAGRIRILRTLPLAEEIVRQLHRFTGLDGEEDDLLDMLVAAFDEVDGGDTSPETMHSQQEREQIRPVAAMMSRARSGGRRGLYT